MPIARHPPYSPGRAVFPHLVLRLYSLPRCKAEPSGTHSPTWNLRNTRTRYLDAVEDVGKLLPRVAGLLASPPVEPFERTVHRPMEDAVERAGVSSHAIVVVVPRSRAFRRWKNSRPGRCRCCLIHSVSRWQATWSFLRAVRRMTRGTPCRSGIQKNSNPRKVKRRLLLG